MAAKTAIEKASRARVQAKNEPGSRPVSSSASYHDAISTIGTSSAVSATITRPRPSTPTA